MFLNFAGGGWFLETFSQSRI